MPSLTTHKADKSVKMLFVGDSGTGKTGALASLAKAGYRLLILDYDNGLDILAALLADDPDALARITYVTLTDKIKAVGDSLMTVGAPKAFPSGLKLLTTWKTETEDFGTTADLDQHTIVVIDSLTLLSKAAFRYVDAVNNFKDGRQTYGEAQKKLEYLLQLLYSDQFHPNVIITSHITYIDLEYEATKAYPSSIGKSLSPQIPRYFNTVLLAKTTGTGTNAKRVIRTTSDGLLDLKHPYPGKVPNELPLATGLADFFRIAKGEIK